MADMPTHLDLTVGDERTLELPGLGTSGYVWEHDIHGADGVLDVQWTRGHPPGTRPAPVGLSAPEFATIRAQRRGEVELVLYQHRHWEPRERARAEHRISVLVRPS